MRTVVWSQDYVNKQTHYQTHTPIQGLWYFEVLWYIATYIQISPYGGPNLPFAAHRRYACFKSVPEHRLARTVKAPKFRRTFWLFNARWAL
jgi:hypothetical protein